MGGNIHRILAYIAPGKWQDCFSNSEPKGNSPADTASFFEHSTTEHSIFYLLNMYLLHKEIECVNLNPSTGTILNLGLREASHTSGSLISYSLFSLLQPSNTVNRNNTSLIKQVFFPTQKCIISIAHHLIRQQLRIILLRKCPITGHFQ